MTRRSSSYHADQRRKAASPKEPIAPPTAEELAARMATNATMWIYQQLGRLKRGQRMQPGRWKPDRVGRDLQASFRERFRPEAERLASGRPDPRYAAVRDACMNWATRKFGPTFKAMVVGNHLTGLASGALHHSGAFGVMETVQAAHEILQERQSRLPSKQEVRDLKARLQRFKVSPQTLRAVLADVKRTMQDSVFELLTGFFSIRQDYYRRFFDHRGNLRVKKLPSLVQARERLVAAFHCPGKADPFWGPLPGGVTLKLGEAYDLTAKCLKAAFPDHVSHLTGEGVKQALAYHNELRRRPKYSAGLAGST